MARSLDPQLIEFLNSQRERPKGLGMPELQPPIFDEPAPAVAPPAAAPGPGAAPVRTSLSDIDPRVIEFLQTHDAEAKDYNDRRDLNEGIGRSMNYFMRKPVGAGFPAPKVDDEMQKFLIHQSTLRSYGAMNDPMRQPPTEEHIRQATAMGIPESMARAAPTVGTLSDIIKQRAKPADAETFIPVPTLGVAVGKQDPTKQIPLPKAPDKPASAAAGGFSRGVEPTYSDETIRRWREQWDTTGELPKGITPRFSPKTVERITNAAPAGEPKPLAEARATYGSDSKSLAKQQQLIDLTKSWEETGQKNLDNMLAISQKLVNSGSPLLNKPLRYLYASSAGDPTVIAFRAAHSAVVNEYAKILSGATGGAGVTEGARHEAEAMMPLDSTPEQLMASANVLKLDAANRLKALHDQVEITRARTGGRQTEERPSAPAEAPASVRPAGGSRRPTRTVGNETREWNGTTWVAIGSP